MKIIYSYILSFIFISSFAQGIKAQTAAGKKHTYVPTSVLASGTWIKLKVNQDGIYKITYNDLVQYGIDPTSIDPRNIRIFGNGNGMLPERNTDSNTDDLIENAIYVYGESDGVFDTGDYILFYGQSPVKWTLDPTENIFKHAINYYSNETCYFLTYDKGRGKRIQVQNSSTLTPTQIVTKFNDYQYHEKDSISLLKSGKEWYGEYFDVKNSYSFNFLFPNIDLTSKAIIRVNIAARNTGDTTQFNVMVAGNTFPLNVLPISGVATADFAKYSEDTMSFFLTNQNLNVNISCMTSGSIGWMNFIDVNVVRSLSFCGPQMIFRNTACVGNGNISEFKMSNSNSSLNLWDITNIFNIKQQQYSINTGNLQFIVPTDSMRQFIVFDGTSFFSPTFDGVVPNQNLHGLAQTDMIIVTYPDFISQANIIENIHSTLDNLNVIVVTPQQIYNEFSSGSQDVGAIRNFARMFYDRASSHNEGLKYLLLFGNGSFDYKGLTFQNSNFVPTYESYNSLIPTVSYDTDDFFGILDSTGGYNSQGNLNIGIGRFPCSTLDEAKGIVNKVEWYIYKINNSSEVSGDTSFVQKLSGDWRNWICFVADDEDNNLHIGQANQLATYVDTADTDLNIEKIYLDAFVEVHGPTGDRYPDVNKAITKRIEEGCLLINYTGHSGETGWAAEQVLQYSNIENWNNLACMPIFVTSSCEFSCFDDPERTSAGEQVLLNPYGGGIALFTTTRLAFSNSNAALNQSFCKYALKKYNGGYYRFGDIIRLSKIDCGSIINNLNFVLLGDPALKLSFPDNTIITTEINGHPACSTTDTLKALSKVTVSGIIQSPTGLKLTNFNGTIYPTVYDKKYITTTLANDPTSFPFSFFQQNHILYKGKASVINGDFNFTYIVPKNVEPGFGLGKISYYATDSIDDARGFYKDSCFIVGGIDTNIVVNKNGPTVKLYMNDTTFKYGGYVNENPLLLSYLEDSCGIDVSGFYFGHDITAVLDGNTEQTIDLNDFYTPDINTYQSGVVLYPFINLSLGTHTLKLKAWDINNNSAEAFTEFVVANNGSLALKNVYNYPNPFNENTYFYFEHNKPCSNIEVEIDIYTITGILTKTIKQTINNAWSDISNSIIWNGCADNGKRLDSGVYPYHIKIESTDGSFLQSSNKLIILR